MITENNFPDIRQLNLITDLFNNTTFEYLALIEYDQIIDYYLLKDLSTNTLNQLSYYLFTSFEITTFNQSNIKIFKLNQSNDTIIEHCFDRMNSNINQLVYDKLSGIDSSL